MKIIRFVTLTPVCTLDFHPDSALLLPGRPMFYPGGGWVADPVLAVRLNRLGKCVAEKFASRYYDTLAPAVRFRPSAPDPSMEGELSGMDSSITHGEWTEPGEFLALGSIEIAGQAVGIPYTVAEIDRAVSRASRHTTVKMGDILLLPLSSPAIPVTPRSRLIATAHSGREMMNVKIV